MIENFSFKDSGSIYFGKYKKMAALTPRTPYILPLGTLGPRYNDPCHLWN